MVIRDDLENATREIAFRHLQTLAERANEQAAEWALNGALNNSRYVFAVDRLVEEASRSIAEAVAEVISQACGSNSPQHVDVLEQVAMNVTPELISIYKRRAANRSVSAGKLVEGNGDIEARIAEIFKHCARELRLGITRRRAATAMGDTYISNSTGVAVGSDGAAIQVGRDNLNQVIGWQPGDLLEAIKAFRDALRVVSDLPKDTKTILDDAALNIEREAKEPSPDLSRLRRLASYLIERVDTITTQVAASVLGGYISSIMAALPK